MSTKDVIHLALIKKLDDENVALRADSTRLSNVNAVLRERIEWLQDNQHGALIETVEQLKAERDQAFRDIDSFAQEVIYLGRQTVSLQAEVVELKAERDQAQRHADEHARATVRMQHEREELRGRAEELADLVVKTQDERAALWAECTRLRTENAQQATRISMLVAALEDAQAENVRLTGEVDHWRWEQP